ncbi:hypothetical protein IU448_21215 [Nocardia flavorosea]|uniref:hypothetical protein n=1 Tax=Nocardia flavorosea TaxID=53429 RepID=UPI001895F53F|nr:hypothetical protein [Nocardia flavorosea]MBF6351511.1 hypothetical protein [Nocardia flavorosea]
MAETQQTTLLQQWQTMKTQAESGELRMEADISDKLKARCHAYKTQLEQLLIMTDQLQYVEGFGGLRSAGYLRNKFANKAVADADSAANRLKTAIDIVSLMEETFELTARRLEETDQSTSSALGNAGV